MRVWLYEDDAEAGEWVKDAKAGYRDWAQKIGRIQEMIAPTRSAFDELLRDLDKVPPDLLVVDLDIQGDHGAGVAAIKRVRIELQREVPIVVFSSTRTKAARESAYEAGATSYVKKPAVLERRVEVLADIFGYWLELHQRRH